MSEQNKFYKTELLERVNFSPELAVFRFRRPEPFRFTAGQYATLALEEGVEIIERAYSIVSSPYEPYLEFFIELVTDGHLTPKLWKLQPNDQILIRKRIVGDFVLDEESGRTRHLMLATVTGIAPFTSIIRTEKIERRRGKESPHRFLIIHGASHSRELGSYRRELEELSGEGWVRYVPTISRPWGDEGWKGEVGRVEDVLRKYSDRFGYDHKRATVYAVGHPSMIENTQARQLL
jgi:ferredoxin/flavodoxin---NADP+ reductase